MGRTRTATTIVGVPTIVGGDDMDKGSTAAVEDGATAVGAAIDDDTPPDDAFKDTTSTLLV